MRELIKSTILRPPVNTGTMTQIKDTALKFLFQE
jgi:hypothetical protein